MSDQEVENAIDIIKKGRFVIVADDETRENEGDLIFAAEKASAQLVGFMVRHTSGLICCSLPQKRLKELKLPLMVHENTETFKTAFTVTVDAKEGIATGISAEDRAKTLNLMASKDSIASDFSKPGHILPLQAKEGGVLKRAGHTEAALDLAKMAGLSHAGVLCELVRDDGSMMRKCDLIEFAKKHHAPFITIADLVRYRRKKEKLVTRVSTANIPTKWGNFTAHVFKSDLENIEHLALAMGDLNIDQPTLARVHSECLTGDIFHSFRCDCGEQLEMAMEMIAREGRGVIIYLRGHEGRGIGLGHKLRAYKLQEGGLDTVEANEKLGLPIDSREYGIGAQILHDLGVREIRIMTNNPNKYSGLEGYNLKIVERVSVAVTPNCHNKVYLRTKAEKMGHATLATTKD